MKAESFVRAPWAAEKWLHRASLLALAGPLVTGVFLASIALVVQRRLAGALLEPLGPGSFLATSAALLLLAGWSRACWPTAFHHQSNGHRTPARAALLKRLFALAMLTLALLGILALAVPGTSALALGTATGAWLLTAIGVLARERFGRRMAPGLVREPGPPRESRSGHNLQRSTNRPVHREQKPRSTDELRGAIDDSQIVQHLVRRQTSTSERIDGWLRCEFSPGQRTAALHVAFCPPLPVLPTVEARIDPQYGALATCKVAEHYAHGARFEVRLASPARQATTARVVFSAAVAETESANAVAAEIHDAPDGAIDSALDR